MSRTHQSVDPFESGHALVKFLKNPSNCSHNSGLSKIQIARQAWDDPSLYIPNKADFLRDWIVDSWLRVDSQTILDPSYHELIAILGPHVTSLDNAPFPLLSTYCRTASTASSLAQLDHRHITHSLRLLCNRASQPIKTEIWVQVWLSLIEFLSNPASATPGNQWHGLWELVINDWQPRLNPDSNNKLAQMLLPAAGTYALASFVHPELLHSQSSFTKHILPISVLQRKDPLEPILQHLDGTALPGLSFIPALLRDYISYVNKDRYDIFSQPSSSKTSIDVFVANKARLAVQSAVCNVFAYLDSIQAKRPDILSFRLAVWKAVLEWGGYLEGDLVWGQLISTERDLVIGSLSGDDDDQILHSLALRILEQLEILDHGEVHLNHELVAFCLTAPRHLHASAEGVLLALIRYHNLTHSMPVLLTLLDNAYTGLMASCDSKNSLQAVYELLVAGPLTLPDVQHALRRSRVSTQHVKTSITSRENYPQNNGLSGQYSRKRRLSETDFDALTAALYGIRSRLILLLFHDDAQAPPIRRMLACVISAEGIDYALAENPIKHISWWQSVLLSAHLRLATGLKDAELDAFDVALLHGRFEGIKGDEFVEEQILYLTQKLITIRSTKTPVLPGLTERAIDFLLHILEEASNPFAQRAWDIMASRGSEILSVSASLSQIDKFYSLAARQILNQSISYEAGRRILANADILEVLPLKDLTHDHSFFSVVLGNLPRHEQEAQFKHLIGQEKFHAADGVLEWVTKMLADESHDLTLEDTMAEKIVDLAFSLLNSKSSRFPDLWRNTISYLCRNVETHSKSLQHLLQQLDLPRFTISYLTIEAFSWQQAKLAALENIATADKPAAKSYPVKVVASLQSMKKDLFESVCAYLNEDAWSQLEHPKKERVLSYWRVLLLLQRCLGANDPMPSCGTLLLKDTAWSHSADCVTSVLQILQLEAGIPLGGTGFLALCLEQDMPRSLVERILHETSLSAYAETLQAALQALEWIGEDEQIVRCINLIEIVMTVSKEGSGHYVRQGIFELSQYLTTFRRWHSSNALAALHLFRGIIERKPFIIGRAEGSMISDVIFQILSTKGILHTALGFSEAVFTIIALLRHPQQPVDISLAMAITIEAFSLLARNPQAPQAACRGLGLEQAKLVCKLLGCLTDTRSSATTLQSIAKHAPLVLVAFIRVAADPRGGFDVDVRRELRSGLLSICDVLTMGGGVNGRVKVGEGLGDAFGLGTGPGGEAERDLWAKLWGEWKLRRYKGQG